MITNNGLKIAINRIAKSTPDYTVIEKVKFGTEQVSISATDNDLTKPVPFSKWAIVNECDVLTDWVASNAQSEISLNTTTYKEGIAAINLYKSSATDNTTLGLYNSSLTSRNATDKYLNLWLYVDDQDTIDKVNYFRLEYGTDSSNYYRNNFAVTTGWNYIRFKVSKLATTGSPDITNCEYFSLKLSLLDGTDTFAVGKIIIDDIYLIEDNDLIGDIDVGYPEIDENNSEVKYRATLGVTEGNGFLLNSFSTFNTDVSPLMQDVFIFPNISKTSSDEIVIEFRNRLVRRT